MYVSECPFSQVVGGWVAGEVCLGSGAQNLRDQIIAVLRLLETTEGHLGAGDVLLGVLEVVELQTVLVELWQ